MTEETRILKNFNIAGQKTKNTLPSAYRLVTRGDGNGNTVYSLQGYFAWVEDWNHHGGEWQDLETQDLLHARDDVPFGSLL